MEKFEKYFFKFLPKESNFKFTVANTDRFRMICAALQDPVTEAYTSFCADSTAQFEDFLLQFQSDEPRKRLLYFSMCKLTSNLSESCCLVWIPKILVDIH